MRHAEGCIGKRGTFAEESEKVIYGLVYPIKTFEIFYIQLHYYLYLWKKSTYYTTITHKILTFLNGPSWKPGKPRLGDHVDNPKVTGSERPHDSRWALPLQLYVVLHFLLLLVTYHNLFDSKTMLSQITIFSMTCYILLTLTSLGFIIDQRASAALLEMLRCIVMVTMLRYNVLTVPLLPLLPWATQCFHTDWVLCADPGVVCRVSALVADANIDLLQMRGSIDHKIGVPLALLQPPPPSAPLGSGSHYLRLLLTRSGWRSLQEIRPRSHSCATQVFSCLN
uniref:Alkylglycerol monooxygenase C-terminal domain-containing protein n=1 Tax=Knipowitschia caucasica TaxID=637954 RepID=A0AAV2MGB4_KNICA